MAGENQIPTAWSKLWMFRKSAIILLTPIILLPLPLHHNTQVVKCIYMICLMSVYWVTEACPMAVTALLPVVLCPLLGLQEANTVTMQYARHTNFLVVGTLIMCIGIEESGLHRRVALKVLLWFGSQPRWILLGLMVISGFLSMWLMNLSTVSLMLPITLAVCSEMKTVQKSSMEKYHDDDKEGDEATERILLNSPEDTVDPAATSKAANLDNEDLTPRISDENIEKAMLFGICYSSTIGGISTIIGTPANLIALGSFEDKSDQYAVNFLTWLCFCLPISATGLLICWMWIQIRFLSVRDMVKRSDDAAAKKRVQKVLQNLYNDLPPMSFAEKAIGAHFIILVFLWVFRDPRVFPGWSSLFYGGYPMDSTTAMVVGMSVFLFPKKSSSFSWIWRRDEGEELTETSPSLLEWATFQKKFPWDIFVLLGSGYALAQACVDSGLSDSIGSLLVKLDGAPTWLIILSISTLTSIATEFTSNSATVSILIPILLPMSQSVDISPVEVLLAVTLSASFAFALPVATPTNAIIFSTGSVTIRDMILTGIPLNFAFVLLLNVMIPLTGPKIFIFDNNSTASQFSGTEMSWNVTMLVT